MYSTAVHSVHRWVVQWMYTTPVQFIHLFGIWENIEMNIITLIWETYDNLIWQGNMNQQVRIYWVSVYTIYITDLWSASRTLLNIFSGKYGEREREPTYQLRRLHYKQNMNLYPVLYSGKLTTALTATQKYNFFLFLDLKNVSAWLTYLSTNAAALSWSCRIDLACHV